MARYCAWRPREKIMYSFCQCICTLHVYLPVLDLHQFWLFFQVICPDRPILPSSLPLYFLPLLLLFLLFLLFLLLQVGITCHNKSNWTIVVVALNKNALSYISNSVSSPPQFLVLFKETLLLLMLCAPVFIFISSNSALLGCPRCGLSVWLSLLAIFNALLSLCQLLQEESTIILGVRHFRMTPKWPPTVIRRAKH